MHTRTNPYFASRRISDSVFLVAGDTTCLNAANKQSTQGGTISNLVLTLPFGVYKAKQGVPVNVAKPNSQHRTATLPLP